MVLIFVWKVLAVGINVPEDSNELESIASDPFFVFKLDERDSYMNAIFTISFLTPQRICDPICNNLGPHFPHFDSGFN